MKKRWLWMIFTSLGCGVLGGCDGPTVGTDTGNPSISENFGCEAIAERQVSDADDTGLGFDAAEIWRFAAQGATVSVRWEPTGGASVGSRDGTATELRLELTREGTTSTVVDQEPRNNGNLDEGPLVGAPDAAQRQCADQLRMDVTLRLSTADGALAEEVDAVLVATHGKAASARVAIPVAELQGDLQIELGDAPEGTEITDLLLDVSLTPWASQGSLSVQGEGSNSMVAWAGGAELTRWPEGSACTDGSFPVSLDSEVFAFSMADALSQVGVHAPDTFTWQGSAEPTELDFQVALPDSSIVCARLVADVFGPRLLKTDALLSMKTGDDRVDGTWTVELSATPDAEGALESLQIVRQTYLADTAPADQFPTVFGVQGVDFSGYDVGALQVSWTWSAASTPGHGSLAVLGGQTPDCVNAPPPQPGANEGGTSGCSGVSYTELAQGQF